MGGPEERREARAGVDGAAPRVREADALQLREAGEEVPGELGVRLRAVVVLGTDPAAVRVDRVVAAPQDAVVGGEAEVVELVRRVAEALSVLPADRGELVGGERLRHQGVVVDRDRVGAHALDQAREDVRAEGDLACAHLAVGRAYGHAGAVRLQGEGGGVLVDADAEVQAGPLQAPHQLRRVEHGDAAAVVKAGLEGR